MKIGDERGRAIDQEPVHNKEFASDGCRGEIEIEGRIQSHDGRSCVMGTLITYRPSFFNRVPTLAFAAADAQRASQSSPSAGHPRTPTPRTNSIGIAAEDRGSGRSIQACMYSSVFAELPSWQAGACCNTHTRCSRSSM